jgi:hypothetical protein
VLADPLRCWIPNPHPCLHGSQQLFLELLTEEIERSTTRSGMKSTFFLLYMCRFPSFFSIYWPFSLQRREQGYREVIFLLFFCCELPAVQKIIYKFVSADRGDELVSVSICLEKDLHSNCNTLIFVLYYVCRFTSLAGI